MSNKLNKYKSFSTLEEATAFALWLEEQGIPSAIEDNSPQLSSIFIGDSMRDNYFLKIRKTDFEIANRIYTDKVYEAVQALNEDYFLNSYSNKELLDITEQPENWDEFNIQAALKILVDRGVKIEPNSIEDIKVNQLIAESQPESGQEIWITLGYWMAFMGGFLGIIIGNHLHTSKKTLRDGNIVYRYTEADRKQGKRIFLIGLVVFLLFLSVLIGVRIKENL